MKNNIILMSAILCGLFLSTTHAREINEKQSLARDIDISLLRYLVQDDFQAFSDILAQGADPTVWFENSSRGWVLCAATESGKESYLELLISEGVDIDFRQSDIASDLSTALHCAVRNNNSLSLKKLLSAGADPTVRECIRCNERVETSVLWSAVLSAYFDLAIILFSREMYSEGQMKAVIALLEEMQIPSVYPGNPERLKLADQIRDRGYDVNLWQD